MATLLQNESDLPGELKAWYTGSNTVHILLTGKSGVGKSALVNCLVGKDVADEGDDLDPVTMIVSPYKTELNGVEVTVWDSPGLQDGTGNEKEYLDSMKQQCKSYDLVLYCVKMSDTRFRDDDIEAMKKLTDAFGSDFWKNSVVVLTFANVEKALSKTPDKYNKKVKLFLNKVQETLKHRLAIAADIAEAVPVITAGYIDKDDTTSRKLHDCKDWLSRLWNVSILRMKEGAQPAMLKVSLDRLKPQENITEEDLRKPGPEQPIAYVPDVVKYGSAPSIFTLIGTVLGGVAAGPAGAAVGAAAGGALGATLDGIMYFFS